MRFVPMKVVALLVLGYFSLLLWIGLNFLGTILSQLEVLYGKGF